MSLFGIRRCACLIACAIGGSPAFAQLVSSPGGQIVYDASRNLSWLADANLAVSQKFGITGINSNGSMSWTAAQAWIQALNVHRYLGISTWRLPETTLPDHGCSQNPKSAAFGYDCTASEMGALYYRDLGGVPGSTIGQTHNAFYGAFTNFQPYLYWSSTLWPKVPNSAFSFSFGNGFQGTNVFANAMYAIPVTSGKAGF